jgi:hypothetical protein
VDDLEGLVADRHGIAVVQRARPARVVAVGEQFGVERVEDGVEFADVIAVLVGQGHGVEVVGVLGDDALDARHGPGVHEDVALAEREGGVAGERLRALGDGEDFHAPFSPAGRLRLTGPRSRTCPAAREERREGKRADRPEVAE